MCWRILVFLLPLLLLSGCNREPQVGEVIADDVYLEFFGPPPVPKSGTAWARVGFLPLSDGSGRLAPLPFFFYRDDRHLQFLLDQMTGKNLRFAMESGLVNPFPEGSRAVTANRVAGVREINLVLPVGAAVDLDTLAAVLVETAGRFPGVQQVRLSLKGESWPGMPEKGFATVPGRVAAPGPPRPLMVLADLAADPDHPAELLVSFDRPIQIERFFLADVEGQKIEGDYFQSVFDMAVVVHPKQPGQLKAGQPLRVNWTASDVKGRQGSGEVVLPVMGRGH